MGTSEFLTPVLAKIQVHITEAHLKWLRHTRVDAVILKKGQNRPFRAGMVAPQSSGAKIPSVLLPCKLASRLLRANSWPKKAA